MYVLSFFICQYNTPKPDFFLILKCKAEYFFVANAVTDYLGINHNLCNLFTSCMLSTGYSLRYTNLFVHVHVPRPNSNFMKRTLHLVFQTVLDLSVITPYF
jgi:hypothetical protein